jgi:N-acetylglucosamine-6-phosphate deacetylase
MITDYGVAIHDAFNMASINPAKALKLNEKMGSLEEGKKADFILLNKDFCITSVFKRGQKIK